MADTVVSRLLVDIGVDLSDLKKGFGEASGAIDGFTSKASSASSALGKLFTGAAIAGVAGLAAGLGVATKSAMDFEKTLSGVQAVSGASIAQMKELSDLALKLGADTSFSATEAAQGIEELVKAGVSMADVMGGAAKASLDLAAAGGISVADAATIASNAMNQFGIKGKDMAGVADLIAGAANASAIDVGQFKFSLQSVGAVAATVGMSFKDTATAIAVLGQAGITGSDAGTSLKTMLMGLQPQTKEQTKLFRELGLMTKDGKNQFFDATGKLKDFATVSQILQDALKDQTEQQRVATLETLFGTDAIRAAAVFTKQGAGGFRDMAKAMGEVSAAEVAEARLNNLSGSIGKLTGSLSTVAITIGMGLTPALKQLVDWATSVINYWMPTISLFASQLPGAIEYAQQVVSDFVAMGGDALTELGQIVGDFVGLALDDYAAGWDTWVGIALRSFDLVESAVGDAVTWLRTNLGAALSWLTDTGWPLLTGAAGAFTSYVTGVFIPVVRAAWDWLAPKFQAALTWMISTGWPMLTGAISSFGSWVQSSGIPMLRSVWDWLATKIGAALTWATETAWPGLQRVMTTAWTWITTSLLPTLGVFWDWLSPKIGAALTWLTNTAWPSFMAAGAAVWQWLTEKLLPALSDWWTWLQDRLSPIYTWFITYAWPHFQTAGASVVEWVKTSLLPTLSEWWTWLQDRLSPIYSWFIDYAWPQLKAAGSDFWSWLTTSLIPTLSDWWNWWQEKLGPAAKWWIDSGFPGLGGGAKELARWNALVISTWKDLNSELAKTDFGESWTTIFENLARFGEYIVNNLDLGGWFISAGEGATKGSGAMAYFAEMLAWISRKLASLSALLPGGKAPPDIGAPPKAPSGGGSGGSSWTGGGAKAPPTRTGGTGSPGGGSGGGSGGSGGGGSGGGSPVFTPQPVTPSPAPAVGNNFDMSSRAAMIASAKAMAEATGIGLPGDILAAIPIQESGFPGTDLGRKYHNWYSIKATPDWKGPTVDVGKVWEVINGQNVYVPATWRVYGSDKEAMLGFEQFLQENSRYKNALSIWENTRDPVKFIKAVGAAGYATDPTWADKVASIAGYAKGGWAGLNGPELAVLGERGPEYVVPNNALSRIGGDTYITVVVNGSALASKEQIADAVVVGLRQAQVTGRTKVTVV